jgi:hypothetical protein
MASMAVTREVDVNPSPTACPPRGAITRGRTRACRGSCGVAAGLALAVTAAVAACGEDRILDPHADDVAALTRAIVSNPVNPVPNVSGAALSGATAGEAAVAYVSLPPGSLPDGEHVTIQNRRSGTDAATAMWDGGFDPVPVEAAVGDTLDLEFRLAGSGGPVHVSHIVPLSRGPVVVRTDPPPRRRDVPLNAVLAIVFSEPIDAQSVTTESVRLLRDGSPVSGAVTLVPGSPFRVELAPDELLEPLTDYVLVVTTEVHDLDGDALEEELRVEFTTESNEGLALVSGDNQPGKAGQELAEPFLVRVTDAHGLGVENVEVTWTVASGEGVLDGLWTRCGDIPGTPGWEQLADPIPTTSVRTDAAGLARISFMPTWFGPVTVKAEATGVPGGPVTFTTDASDPGATVEIVPFHEEYPRIWAWSNHSHPLVVVVNDGQGEFVPYVPVNWRVESGTGELYGGCSGFDPAALTVRTDVQGWSRYSAVDFKHKAYGLSTVSAAVPGVRDSPVTFELDATRVVVYVTGDGFLGPEGSSDIVVGVGARVEFLLLTPHEAEQLLTAHIVSTSSPPGGVTFDSGILQDSGDWMFNQELFGFGPNVPGTWEFVDQVSGATGTLTAQ